MSLHEGETILDGKYRILKLIGEGATARVWLAEEPEFAGRYVAIKELKRETLTATELEEQERRFRQEVEMAAQLEQAHVPHVIRALTLEHLNDGTRLLVMEYAEGGSLADRIAEHPQGMPIEEAVQIALDICQALQAFHELPSGPVHRDIKPSNILFDRQGKAYLADFGLCQLPGRSGRTQMQAGPHPATPLYAAPEQLRSPEPLTPAADIFALGCVLFEMLTGKPYKRVRPGTKPSALRSEVPAWLNQELAKALHEDRGERWQSAGEFTIALETAKRPPTEITLAPDGSDDYPTLATAVAAVAEGGTIRLMAGEYWLAEPLLIEKPVRLVGAGTGTTVIMCEGEGYVVRFAASGPFAAEGITFRHEGKAWANVVEVADGRLDMARCRLIGGVWDKETKSGGNGLLLCGTAGGVIKKCVVENNGRFGIQVRDQAQPTLEGNTCRRNPIGIICLDSAGGIARGNECTGGMLGIGVGDQAQPRLEENTCQESEVGGIDYFGNAGGVARGNKCIGGIMFGISVREQARPTLEGNTCRENKMVGINYSDSAGGVARGNECTGGMFGIDVSDQAQPKLEGNICRGNGGGIVYSSSAGGVVRGNECTGGTFGITVRQQAQPKLEENTCRKNEVGIGYLDSAGGIAWGNECAENVVGIEVREQAQPKLEENTCRGNERVGIRYLGSAGGVARGNECAENRGGIGVVGQAQPKLEENSCRENGAGIFYADSAGGVARGNECAENEIGIGVVRQAQPMLEENSCRENRAGIFYADSASGAARGNECAENRVGISVAGQAQPTLEENSCRENEEVGILYLGSAGGIARGNECAKNRAGIVIREQARPTLEGNTCRENKIVGINYEGSAGGVARSNECTGNIFGIVVARQAQPRLELNTCRNNMAGIYVTAGANPRLVSNYCYDNQYQDVLDKRL